MTLHRPYDLSPTPSAVAPRRVRVTALLACAVLAAAPPARAGDGHDTLPPDCRAGTLPERDLAPPLAFETGDPLTLRAADGRLYRQADLSAMEGRAFPLVPETLRFVGFSRGPDRWQRQDGHFADGNGRWLARDLVREGLALVSPRLASRDCLRDLFALEAEARARRKGLWASERVWSAHRPDELALRTGRFTLVAGRVLSVGETRSTVYLNFGRRWSRDFTVTLPARQKAAFAAAGLDVASLDGAAIRVRGTVRRSGGPSMELFHPAQIERLDKDGTRR